MGASISAIRFVPGRGVNRAIFGTKFRAQKLKGGTFIQSNGFSLTSIDFSLVCTKLSLIMADAFSSSSSEQESDSNESFGLSSWDGFSSSSSDSSEDDSRTGCGKPAT